MKPRWLGRMVRVTARFRLQRLWLVVAVVATILALAGVAGAENYKY